jgi:hypothetical protein
MDFVRGGAELALHEVVGLDPAPELLILAALLFAQAADLDQIGDHYQPSSRTTCAPGYNQN